jgi:ABC-type glucose/galactose transport system permease subunit
MNPLDLIQAKDGSVSLTKLQAATFHALLAVTVAWVTWIKRDFVEGMWALYAAVAVGHAVIDKTGAQIAAFKDRKLDAETEVSREAVSGTPAS